MNQYIINSPQLQSFAQRIGAFFVWLICWLMWVYLLLPFLTLCGWLLGNHSLTDEMRWFGGYKSLLQLLQIYGMTLLALLALWIGWVIYHYLRQPSLIPAAHKMVTEQEIIDFYQVDAQELHLCRVAQIVTVVFDAQGQIIQLEAHL